MLDNLEWLADAPGATADDGIAQRHKQWWPVFIRAVGKPLPDEVMEIGELLGKEKGRIARYLFMNEPRTLLHGDYSVGNLLFGPTGEEAFFVVDWQLMKRGRGIWDVVYFLSQNLIPADSQAIEMDLLHDYLKIMEDHGVRNYSFDDAMYDYRISLLHRFGSIVSTIAAMPFTKKQIKRLADELVPRFIAAVLDNNCRALLGGGS